MAKVEYNSMNRNRLLYSKILMVVTLIVAITFQHSFKLLDAYEVLLYISGFILAVVGALGRLYSTTFLGGHKANKIIDYGPYSMVRNPLYFFSFTAVLGLCLMSDNILIIAAVPLLFLMIYYPLVLREERYLKDHFGAKFEEYCARTPRLIPSFKNYKKVKTLECCSDSLTSAFQDSIWWFAGIALFSILYLF